MSDESGVQGKRAVYRIQPRGNGISPGQSRNTGAHASILNPGEGIAVRRPGKSDGTIEGAAETIAGQPGGGEVETSGGSPAVQEARTPVQPSGEGIPENGGPKDGAVRRGVSEEDSSRAKRLFADIGNRFNINRKKSKASAYEQYQRDLMENMDTLVLGGVISLKEITATITDLETYMRDNTGETGKSQAQLLAEWLTAEVSIAASPAPE